MADFRQARAFVGFDPADLTPGFLCDPASTSVPTTIRQNGFIPFPEDANGLTCRGDSL
jgi:hypothetical protein